MDALSFENQVRWRAYWLARREGWSEGPTYDRYVHPDSRVNIETVMTEYPSAAQWVREHDFKDVS